MSRLLLLLLWVAAALAAAFSLAWGFVAALAGSKRALRIAIVQDQAANAAIGGSEDETISSRAGKAKRAGRRWGCVLCGLLDRLDPQHCDKSIEEDEGQKPGV